MKKNNKDFNKLFIPIVIEQFFFQLMSQIDIIMLASVGLSTVTAVGLANQMLMIISFLLTIIHVGVTIRTIHIKNKDEKYHLSEEFTKSIVLNLFATMCISLFVLLFIDNILQLMNIPQDVYYISKSFSIVLVCFMFVHSTNMLIGTILRILGYAKNVTYITIFINTINILLNAYILYFSEGRFEDTVVAVAWSTNVSRIIGMIFLLYFARNYIVRLNKNAISVTYIKNIISLGLPSAGENISYHLSQLFLTALIASLGTFIISSKIITQTITGLAFTFALSYAMANQIYLGQYIANKRYAILKTKVTKCLLRTSLISTSIVMMIIILFYIIGKYYFENDAFGLIFMLLLLSIFLEPFRALNVFQVHLLNLLGDVRFPVILNIIVTWIFLIPLSFISIKVLNFGIESIYILMIIDEFVRSILMNIRFNNSKWTNKVYEIVK